MEPEPIEQVVRNVDARLTRVEQILPTLATNEALKEAVARLATKEELKEAVAPLATKAELKEAVAPLATKAEVREAIAEEGKETRRHFDVVAERLEGNIKIVAEGLIGLREHMDERFEQVTGDIAQLDRRVMRLEAERLK